jgi:RHS repeat-associated protein
VLRTYDGENRMTKEVQANSYVAGSYSYNADGQRVRRTAGGVETWQVYGVGGELLAEYAKDGAPASPQKEYGYRGGQLLVQVTAVATGGAAPVFSDNPLVPYMTLVYARHITELRTAINQLRARAGLSAASWADPIASGINIKAAHIQEMRDRLDEGLTRLGLPAGDYSGGLTTGQPILAVHIQELRNRLISAQSAVILEWLVTDQLGTPRMILDQTGSLAGVRRHDYLPFGEELLSSTGVRNTVPGYFGSDIRQKFTSKERDDETGLDYFGARYYSSAQGRFTSADEFTGGPDEYYEFHDLAAQNPTFYADLTDPQSLNKYQYCYNNPLLYIDPDGHQGVREWFQNTLNGAASVVSENNGLGGSDAPQTSTGRAIGHVLSLAQSAAEIVGGGAAVVGGGGEAVVTSPAAATGVGVVVPAAGVVTAVAGAVVTVHGAIVGVRALNNIFTKRKGDYSTSEKSAIDKENAAKNNGVNRCDECGREVEKIQSKKGVKTPDNQLQRHHRKKLSDGGASKKSNTDVLCKPCHDQKHY